MTAIKPSHFSHSKEYSRNMKHFSIFYRNRNIVAKFSSHVAKHFIATLQQ